MTAMREVTVKVRPEIDWACAVAPGDRLVVAVPDGDHDPDELQRMKAQLEAELPGVTVVMVVGVSGLAVMRGKPTDV